MPTILIVDDTPANIGVIAEALEEHGYRVLVAQDGEEGLRRVDFVQPDLILLDVMMPGMDGFDVCRTLKRQTTTRDIPVIFMTARSDTVDKVTGFQAGGVDYVTKPLQVDEVLVRVETHLKMSNMQKRLEIQNAQLKRYREQLEQRVAERTTELNVNHQHLREEIQERKLTQERLKLVDFALNQSREAVYIQDDDGRIIYVNAEACRMLCYSEDELLSMSISDIEADASPEQFVLRSHGTSERGTYSFEQRHKTKDGRIIPVEIFSSSFEFQGMRRSALLVRDIAERKQKEAMLQQLSRELKAISRCNQTLVRAENESELLNEICKIVCEVAGYQMAWVAFAVNDAGKSVYPAAQFGSFDGYLSNINVTWADTVLGQGPTGTAIRTGETVVNQDCLENPKMAPWSGAAIKFGYRSSLALPLIVNKSVLGAFTIYSAEPCAFTPEEVVLLEELVSDIAYGIQTLRTREEYKQATAELNSREQEFRAMIENSPDIIARYDTQHRRTYINPALQEQFGLSKEEILGKTAVDMSPLSDVQAYMQAIGRVLETGNEEQMELSWRDPQGIVHWGDLRLASELGSDGSVKSVLAIMRDVTGRKQAELALEESREQLRGLTSRREEAREEERKHIAREVHDELGQILTGLQLNVSVLENKFAGNLPQLQEHLAESNALIDKALGAARNVASALRPAVLDMGIVSALEWLAGRFSANTHIQCEMEIADAEIKLDENHAVALFRIVQEALTNISRHAKASRVDISLRKFADDYVLKVRDNGSGFDASLKKMDSFGVVGIRERVLMLGGTFVIKSSPGNGTEIDVHIPINRRSGKP